MGMARRATMLITLVVLASGFKSVSAFENAKIRQRKVTLSEAAAAIRIPYTEESRDRFSTEEVQCAACEATARSLEYLMRNDEHKGGVAQRWNLLVSVCDKIDQHVPTTLAALEEGGKEALSFWPPSQEWLSTMKGKSWTPPMLGLREYCTVFVEEFEDELSEVMKNAEPVSAETMSKASKMAHGILHDGNAADMPRYELKEATCTQATKQCSSDALNKIT